ncbi:MAG: NUDIX hydrolase [Oscillospiraceae bacterium]|nr:NUDIX hydrolase [Oscillospiraceae bacterium]
MERIEIIGENYSGAWDLMRTACRSIVIMDEKILMSYETKTDQWMLPGGGLEQDESEKDCVIRETAEETGLIISPSDCILEIDEFYENCKYVNRYFLGRVTGKTALNLTARETEAGMEPRWATVKEILKIFSRHVDDKETDEMRRGLYFREYTALLELLGKGVP